MFIPPDASILAGVHSRKKSGTGKAPTRKTSICFAPPAHQLTGHPQKISTLTLLARIQVMASVGSSLFLLEDFFPDVVVIKSGNPPSNYLAKPADWVPMFRVLFLFPFFLMGEWVKYGCSNIGLSWSLVSMTHFGPFGQLLIWGAYDGCSWVTLRWARGAWMEEQMMKLIPRGNGRNTNKLIHSDFRSFPLIR